MVLGYSYHYEIRLVELLIVFLRFLRQFDLPSRFSTHNDDLFTLYSAENLVPKMPHRELHSKLLEEC